MNKKALLKTTLSITMNILLKIAVIILVIAVGVTIVWSSISSNDIAIHHNKVLLETGTFLFILIWTYLSMVILKKAFNKYSLIYDLFILLFWLFFFLILKFFNSTTALFAINGIIDLYFILQVIYYVKFNRIHSFSLFIIIPLVISTSWLSIIFTFFTSEIAFLYYFISAMGVNIIAFILFYFASPEITYAGMRSTVIKRTFRNMSLLSSTTFFVFISIIANCLFFAFVTFKYSGKINLVFFTLFITVIFCFLLLLLFFLFKRKIIKNDIVYSISTKILTILFLSVEIFFINNSNMFDNVTNLLWLTPYFAVYLILLLIQEETSPISKAFFLVKTLTITILLSVVALEVYVIAIGEYNIFSDKVMPMDTFVIVSFMVILLIDMLFEYTSWIKARSDIKYNLKRDRVDWDQGGVND